MVNLVTDKTLELLRKYYSISLEELSDNGLFIISVKEQQLNSWKNYYVYYDFEEGDKIFFSISENQGGLHKKTLDGKTRRSLIVYRFSYGTKWFLYKNPIPPILKILENPV